MSFFGPTALPLMDEASAPLLRRALQRARLVGRFAFVQIAVQVIGFLSGILLVRRLDQNEYAFFTIANTMQGTINLLADIGISIGLVSIGSHVWHDARRFGELISTALGLRRRLGAAVIAIVTPIMFYMLVKNGASFTYAALLIALLIAGLIVQLSVGVLGVVPRLRADIGKIQWIDFTGAIVRFALLAAMLLVFLNASVAVAISGAAILLQYLILRRYVGGVIDLSAPENDGDRHAMLGFIKSQAANAVFYCLQGQITVLLISLFARQVSSIAEVGALGRLAMIFSVLSNLLTNIFVPAFARAHDARKLRLLFFGIVGGVMVFSAVVTGTAALFPGPVLFILGSKYAHLHRELVLVVGGAVVAALTGTFWSLNAAKAWITGSWLYIPLTLATQAALIPLTDFSSVQGVLLFNLVAAIPNLLLNLVLSYRGFRSYQPAAV